GGVPPTPSPQAPRPIMETARKSTTPTWRTLRFFVTTRVFPQAPALTTRKSAEKLHPGEYLMPGIEDRLQMPPGQGAVPARGGAESSPEIPFLLQDRVPQLFGHCAQLLQWEPLSRPVSCRRV